MTKNGGQKMDADMLERLSLGFVDRHRKAQSYRKLAAFQDKCILSRRWFQCDPRNEGLFTMMITTDYHDFQNAGICSKKDHACAVT